MRYLHVEMSFIGYSRDYGSYQFEFDMQVTRCTMCQLKVYMYSDLGCQNNSKDFPTQAPSQNIPSID